MVWINPEYRHLIDETQERKEKAKLPQFRGKFPAHLPFEVPEGSPPWFYLDNNAIGSLSEREHLARTGGGFLETGLKLARDRDIYIVSLLARAQYVEPEIRELLKQHPLQRIRDLAWTSPLW
jgi:hypothetical protein